jgi:curved DNA-binding protein CbpA
MKKEINLYDILGIKSSATHENIKNAYHKLVKTMHPDRGGDPAIFELINDAYFVLNNPQKRAEYDELTKVSKQVSSDFSSLKKAADDFFKTQELTEGDVVRHKKKALKEFEKDNNELDKKHGLIRNEIDKKIEEEEAQKRLNDLLLTREQDKIEFTSDNLFEGQQFNLSKFNSFFDAINKKTTDLVPHTGNPDAYYGSDNNSFSSYDNYDTLYDEKEFNGNNKSANIKINNNLKKISKHELKNIKIADYVIEHNKKDSNYNKTLDDLLKEREKETSAFKNRNITDFKEDPNMGGYGIFSGVGITGNELDWLVDNNSSNENTLSKYNTLLELHKTK